mmetsp:Transcript_30119/g.96373  ORF Transcript_30119/g.96373 Transcript_30119/m.96373 type:complete len:203 (-) Transcript_30119:266-874(-)
MTSVVFSLVPCDALDGLVEQRVEHALPQRRRLGRVGLAHVDAPVQRLLRAPLLIAGPAPVHAKQPDGPCRARVAQGVKEVTPKEPADSAEVDAALAARARRRPASDRVGVLVASVCRYRLEHWHARALLAKAHQPDVGIIRHVGNLSERLVYGWMHDRVAVRAVDAVRHVALTRANPDVAEEHVVNSRTGARCRSGEGVLVH